MIKAPYCRQGNKTPILKDIMRYIPVHDVYVEPFVGSAVVFFNLPKAKMSVLNDLDDNVYNILKLIKRAPLEINKYRSDLITVPKIKEFYNKKHHTVADMLLYYKIIFCSGFNGTPVRQEKNIYNSPNPAKILDNLKYYKSMLKGVKITNSDYIDIILKYDSPNTFFFLDPPYENTSKDFYSNNLMDFNKMVEVLKSIKGMFLVTINDSPYIRKIFKGFKIVPIDVPTSWRDKYGNHQIRKELFIMNYTISGRDP